MISIGVHIRQDSVCFAGAGLKGGRPQLEFIEELFFDSSSSPEEKELFISRHIEKIAERRKEENVRFCYALSQSSVTGFLIEFPFKEKFKILKTLPFEIEDKTPFRADKVFFDARICGIKDKSKSSALCFVTPEENVKERLARDYLSKNPPWLLSSEGSALANLLESWNKPLSQAQNPTGRSFYIYLGAQNSQILLYKDGHLNHLSVLDWSVAPIIEEMMKVYNLSAQKAWEEFFGKSFILAETKGWTKEQVFFSNLIKKRIHLLTPALNLLKMSLETEKGISISEAVLFGPGSVIKNLTAFLTSEISVPCSRLRALPDFPDFPLESQVSSGVAFGLALEGLKSSPYQGLNFLQSMRKEAFPLFSKKWRKAELMGLLCFLIFSVYALVRHQESSKILGSIQPVFVDYGKKIAYLEEDRISGEAIQSFLDKEREKTKDEQLAQSELDLPNPMDHLQRIVQKIGPASQWNLTVQYLKAEDEKVEIKGLVNRLSSEKLKSLLQSLAQGAFEDHSSQSGGPLAGDNKERVSQSGGPLAGDNKERVSQSGGPLAGDNKERLSQSGGPLADDNKERLSQSGGPLADDNKERLSQSGGSKALDLTVKQKKEEANPPQKKGSKSPQSPADSDQDERIFFSYSFQLKKGD